MKPEIDYSVYLVTDRGAMSAEALLLAVEQAVIGGCTLVQLREKELSSLDFYHTAMRVKAVTRGYNVPLIVNDRVDVALAADAAGVHIGQSDLPASVVRGLIGGGKILGVSVSDPGEAEKAERDGADYLGVGAMLPTGTKRDARLVSMEALREIRRNTSLPVVVIGGICRESIEMFAGVGIDGIAVSSAILSKKDIAGAARGLSRAFWDMRGARHA